GGGGRTVLRGQVAKAVGRQVAGGAVEAGRPVQLGVVDRLRGGAEAQHHVAAARRGEVVGAEIGAGGVDLDFLELEHVQRLDRDVVGDVDRAPDHVDRQERFLQLGAGHAQGGQVDRVDDVDAVLDEGALAPADHLPAQAHGAVL